MLCREYHRLPDPKWGYELPFTDIHMKDSIGVFNDDKADEIDRLMKRLKVLLGELLKRGTQNHQNIAQGIERQAED